MKFPPFEYFVPATLSEAIDSLGADEDAKVLAGGQSLLPLLALRLARPTVLVDIRDLAMDSISLETGRVLSIGAMFTQQRLVTDPEVRLSAPLVAAAAAHVGHVATRNRGTLGGTLAHADPAAELPAVMLALGADVVVAGPSGTRVIPCVELAESYFMTALDPDEIITEIRVPAASPGHGAAWCEWAPRAGDFAEVGIGVWVDVDDQGVCTGAAGAASGLSSVPVDLGSIFNSAASGALSAEPSLLRHAADLVQTEASAAGEDKAQLAGLLAARALRRAFDSISPVAVLA